LPAVDVPSGQSKNAGKTQAPNNTFVVMEELVGQQSDKQMITEPPGTIAKTTGDGEITLAVNPKLFVPEDGVSQAQQKVPVGQSKSALMTEDSVSQAQQKVPVGQSKSALMTEDSVSQAQQKVPVGDEANIDRQEPGNILEKVADAKPAQIPSGLSPGIGKDQAGNAPGDSAPLKLNLAHLQTFAAQMKEQGTPTTDSDPNPGVEQMLSDDNQLTTTEQSFLSSQVAKTSDGASINDVSAGIAKQIEQHIHTTLQDGDRQITISLHPPELGRVFVRFQEQDDQIIGLLEVAKAQTRYEIEQALPQIIRNLQESGVEIKRLEVVLTSRSEQQAYRDQSPQDSSFQQSHGFSEGKHSGTTTANVWLQDDSRYAELDEAQEALIADNGINMLI
ncbi:MAG: flagellar hook-length control protein FliK, partial [Planctomycetota bacterium]